MSTHAPTLTVHAPDADRPYALVVIGDRSFKKMLDPACPAFVGRGEDCDISIDDATASRRHARIELDAAGATLEDLGSHNGTRLNGKRIAGRERVAAGDVITIGEATLVLYLPRRPAARGHLAGDVIERLEAEVDRAQRYGGSVALVVWDVGASAAGALLQPMLRPCDIVGLGREGMLVTILPGLTSAEAEGVARRGHDLLSAVARGVKAGIATFPADAADAATLLLAARDALGAAGGADMDHPDAAVRRVPLGPQHEALLADPGMVRAFDLLRRLAASDLPVLVSGETGVGKEIAARALHVWSRRASGPFVPVNCAALPESLIESELFGHKKGAFSGADRDKAGFFESASGGTLFLDEIAELPLAVQAKLLRAVDTRTVTRLGQTEPAPVDVRFVAATHRDLAAEVAAARFRADLFFRVSAGVVVLPPLRDRPREIPVLARAFLARACARLGRGPIAISDAAMRLIGERRYPGNVRELAHAMDYAAAVTEGEVLYPWHLPVEAAPSAAPSPPTPAARFQPIADEVAALERRRMLEALEACGGNQSRAADAIGMPRRTFVTKMARFGLR